MHSGELINIDFGFVFGEQTYFDAKEFPIPKGLRDAIVNTGREANVWETFKNSAWDAYLVLSQRREYLVAAAYAIATELDWMDAFKADRLPYLNMFLNTNQTTFMDMVDIGTEKSLIKTFVHTFFG